MGGAEGLQVVTEVTPYALIFGLAGRWRRAALDCCTAPLGQKTLENCKNINLPMKEDAWEQQSAGRGAKLILKSNKIDFNYINYNM